MTRSEFINSFMLWFTVEEIEHWARETKWSRRSGKIKAFEFFLGVVFGQMSALRLTLNAQASHYTEPVKRQAVDQRYTQRAVDLFKVIFSACLQRSMAKTTPVLNIHLAEQFKAIHLIDSTSFDCPDSLAEIFPGCGGDASQANCKILMRYEYLRSQFEPLALLPGKSSDQGLAKRLPPFVAADELLITDKGFFDLELWQQIDQKKAFLLLPWPRSVKIRLAPPDGLGQELDLADVLGHGPRELREWPVVYLGVRGVQARLVAVPLSEESAARQRSALRESQRRQGRVPTAKALEVAGWMILLTNAPAAKLPSHVMSYVYRIRWQIELVFKQCKSVLRLDKTEALTQPFRVQCEIWGRLVAGVVLFTWHSYLQGISLASSQKEISFAQVARHFQQSGMSLSQAMIKGGQQLREYLWSLFRHLLSTATKGRQPSRKTTLENLKKCWVCPSP